MPLLTCPDCESEASDRASTCPQCGFPIAASVVDASYARELEPRTSGGFLVAFGFVLALGVVFIWPSASSASSPGAAAHERAIESEGGASYGSSYGDGEAAQKPGPRLGGNVVGGETSQGHGPSAPMRAPRRPRVLEAVSAPLPDRIHSYELAQRGHALYQHLMVELDLDPDAYQPVLFGSATAKPRAAIYVSTAAWEGCERRERVELAHYVASLVRAHWAAPEVFAGYDAADPNAAYFRDQAALMTADSWVILGGDVCDNGGAHAAMFAHKVLLSGAGTRLSPSD